VRLVDDQRVVEAQRAFGMGVEESTCRAASAATSSSRRVEQRDVAPPPRRPGHDLVAVEVPLGEQETIMSDALR